MSQQQNSGQDPNQQMPQQQGLPNYGMPPGYMTPYGGMNQQQMMYMQQMQQAAAYQSMIQAQPGTTQQAAPQAPYQLPTFPMAQMASPMAMPMFQTQAPQNNFLQPQLDNLKSQVQTLNNDLDAKNNKIRDYEDQIDTLTRQQKRQKQELSDKDVELQEHKTKQIESDNKITALEADIRKAATQNRSLEYQLGVMTKEIENLRQEQEQNENDKQKQIDQMRQDFRRQLQLPIQQQTDPQVGILQAENKKLKAEIQVLKQQLQQYAAQMQGMSTQDQINELQSKIDQEHKYFMDAKDETMRLKKQSETKINELDSTLQTSKTHILKLNNDIKLLNMKLKDSNALSENLKSQLANEQQTNKELEAELRKPQLDRSHIQQIQQAQERVRQQMQQQFKQQELQNAEKQEQLMKEQEEKLKKMLEQKQKDVLVRNKRNQELLGNQMGKAKQNLGTLDVCYIVDSTLSMEPYIKQTRDCIRQSSQLIKQLTNRDTNWSTICYYDIEQKPGNGLHLQHDFTKNMQDIEQFLDGIKTKGGSDPPEDVNGAILQMITNLKWTARFKIALLITDAPCHGIRYHAANMRDNHPNSDIEETILKLMDQNILFIGLNFKQQTTQMYEEFKKIYQAKQKQDIYTYADMNNLAMEKIGAQMAKCIGDASEKATGTNNNSTKSKKAQQARLEAKDGAMEALCSKGNFYDFEKQADVKCVQTKFTVLKIEITQEAFEKNLTEIHNIGTSESDYRVTEEGQWNCIRTDRPFAFGMMKDVFLMKKNGAPDELYVIKTPIGSEPYSTKQVAIAECRSHLLCQQLMNRFQKDIEEATQQKKVVKQYPKVVYSSFLILKESETKYWIAERFFKGEFVKYNNNFGYMNDSQDELNKFAQAFSLYTLYISGARYIINDVQGVGIYFTDPAINTLPGNFDDTDMGEDGMGMFLVNYSAKRHLTQEIEDLLDIKFDDPNQN